MKFSMRIESAGSPAASVSARPGVVSVIDHATHPAIDARKGKRIEQFYGKCTASGNSGPAFDGRTGLVGRWGPGPNNGHTLAEAGCPVYARAAWWLGGWTRDFPS